MCLLTAFAKGHTSDVIFISTRVVFFMIELKSEQVTKQKIGDLVPSCSISIHQKCYCSCETRLIIYWLNRSHDIHQFCLFKHIIISLRKTTLYCNIFIEDKFFFTKVVLYLGDGARTTTLSALVFVHVTLLKGLTHSLTNDAANTLSAPAYNGTADLLSVSASKWRGRLAIRAGLQTPRPTRYPRWFPMPRLNPTSRWTRGATYTRMSRPMDMLKPPTPWYGLYQDVVVTPAHSSRRTDACKPHPRLVSFNNNGVSRRSTTRHIVSCCNKIHLATLNFTPAYPTAK